MFKQLPPRPDFSARKNAGWSGLHRTGNPVRAARRAGFVVRWLMIGSADGRTQAVLSGGVVYRPIQIGSDFFGVGGDEKSVKADSRRRMTARRMKTEKDRKSALPKGFDFLAYMLWAWVGGMRPLFSVVNCFFLQNQRDGAA
jgi:hypothetical protein